MIGHGNATRQFGIFLASLGIAFFALAVQWGLRRARLATYERLDQIVPSLLEEGKKKEAARLIRDAFETYHESSLPPAVLAAAAVYYGSSAEPDTDTSLRFLEAALRAGVSIADRPELRCLYARLLRERGRWARIVELYSPLATEALFPEEHLLKIEALRNLGRLEQAYEAVLGALCCPLDEKSAIRLWGARQELAAMLGLADCWRGLDREEVGEDGAVWLAMCEEARFQGQLSRALRLAERLRQNADSDNLLARIDAFIYTVYRASGDIRKARQSAQKARGRRRDSSCCQLWLTLAIRESTQPEADLICVEQTLLNAAAFAGEPLTGEVPDKVTALLGAYARLCQQQERVPPQEVLEAASTLAGPNKVLEGLMSVGVVLPAGEYRENFLRVVEAFARDHAGSLQQDLLFVLAQRLANSGQPERAARLVLDRIEGIQDPHQLVTIAGWCRNAGMTEEQLAVARRAVSLADSAEEGVKAKLELAIALLRKGALADAERLLRDVQETALFASAASRGLLSEARLALAVALAAQGRSEAAMGVLRSWREEVGTGTQQAEVLYALLVYAIAERLGAPEAYRTDAAARGRLSYVEHARARWKEAAECLTSVLRNYGDSLPPEETDVIRLAAARALVAVEEYEPAARLLESFDGTDAELADQATLELANCYWQLGRRDEARACLERLRRGRVSTGQEEGPVARALTVACSALSRLL